MDLNDTLKVELEGLSTSGIARGGRREEQLPPGSSCPRYGIASYSKSVWLIAQILA